MTTITTKTITTTAALALSVSVAAVSAASATELRLATIVPEGSVWANHAVRYAERVAELSDGALTIEIFANAELGSMQDTMRMAMSGRLDIWYGATPVMAAVTPELATLTLPYLFDSNEQMACTVPAVVEDMRAVIGDTYELLAVTPVGAQNLGTVDPARVPADMEGDKVRSSPLPASIAFFQAMGATPQPISAAETAAALGTGLVEAADLATAYYVLTGSNQVATNYIATQHVQNLAGMIVSARSWAGLSEEEQSVLRQATDVIPFADLVGEVTAFEAQMEQVHVNNGGTVTELTEADMAEWRAVGLGVWDGVMADANDSTRAFLETVLAAREACNG